MELKFKVHTKVQKPVQEVFAAVYEPAKLSGYFTTGGASGPLDEGKDRDLGVCGLSGEGSGYGEEGGPE
jgi:hypothetical protein